mmetsp:Transcript_113755/g.332222  ORF Transcript_113755/g.332222 Transcript_113755/m.332222 type:complete len:258 (+) Transcript_113755:139-912(+)
MSSDCPVPAVPIFLRAHELVRYVWTRALHVRMQLPIPVPILQDLEALQELVPHLHADRETLAIPSHFSFTHPFVPSPDQEVLGVKPSGHGCDLHALMPHLPPGDPAHGHGAVGRARELDLHDGAGLRWNCPVVAMSTFLRPHNRGILQASLLYRGVEHLGPVPVADNLELAIILRQQHLQHVDIRDDVVPFHLLKGPLVPIRSDEIAVIRSWSPGWQSQIPTYVEFVEESNVLDAVVALMYGPAAKQSRQCVVVWRD